MARSTQHSGRRHARNLALALVTVGAAAGAVLVGMALAKSFVLQVAKNAKVMNTKGAVAHENIVVGAHGRAVYTLSGDTRQHPKCTQANSCFQFWPPVKVASAKKPSGAQGVKGKLGVWHRNGFMQLTLGGHPLYTYAADSQSHVATGEGIKGFHGTWHVVKASPANSGSTPTTSTPTTSTTTTSPYPYPPGY
jgi:predicted lipoprotein with Yx(FWY)xxD motif